MRVFPPSLAILLLALPAEASQGPAESALAFAKKLQAGTINLAPGTDTAIGEETSEPKIQSISSRLQRMSAELKGIALEPGPVRIEGKLAGALVRGMAESDPTLHRVIPLAMIQEDGIWKPSPVPASFENTGAGYSRNLRTTAHQLEEWLAREQVREIQRIRDSSADQLRSTLAALIKPSDLRSWSSADVMEQFLKACREGDTGRLLALGGGLSTPYPEHWELLAANIRAAGSGLEGANDVWKRLLAPEALRIPVMDYEVETGHHHIHLACLTPKAPVEESTAIIAIEVVKQPDGLWRIEPPTFEETDRIRSSMLDLFPSKFMRRHPTTESATASELKNRLIEALGSSDSSAWATLVHLDGDPEIIRATCHAAAGLWWMARNPSSPAISSELDFHEMENEAFVAMQWLPLGNLTFSPQILHLEKQAGGWLWNPKPSKESRVAAEAWSAPLKAGWRQNHMQLATRPCPIADWNAPPPDETAAAALVNEWLDALADGRWHHALTRCAKLDTPKSPALLLRNLSYECRNIIQNGRMVVVSQQKGSHLTMVATRKANDTKSADLFIPVVHTPSGPRLLLEIDLGDPTRPGRAFLNREATDRLHDVHPDAAADVGKLIRDLTKIKRTDQNSPGS